MDNNIELSRCSSLHRRIPRMSIFHAEIFQRSPQVTVCGVTSIVLLLISLTQDCFYIDKVDNPRAWSNGFGLLMVGWLGILTGIYSWLANPTLLITWLTIWSPALRKYALVTGVLALIFMLSFLLHEDMMSDEAGNRSKITSYGIGYWLWLGSALVAILGACLQRSVKRTRKRSI